jgi:amino acid transporter
MGDAMSSQADNAGMMPASTSESTDLRRDALPLLGVFAVSIGGVAPSAGIATGVGILFYTAGNGSWLTWVFGTVGIMGCAYAASYLARRFRTTGGLYGLGAQGGGAVGGYFVGLGSMAVGIISGPVLTIGSAIYFVAFFHRFGLNPSKPVYLIAYLLIAAIAGLIAYRDIRLSSVALLFLEAVSLTAIGVLIIASLIVHNGPVFDPKQLGLHGTSVHLIFLGMVFTVFTLGGWDIAATLGKEARNPERAIPYAMVGTVLIIGAIFMVGSYSVVRGFEGVHGYNLLTSQAPFDDLANIVHMSWFGYIVDLGVAFSFLSCTIAFINATSRYIFTLSRDGVAGRVLGRVHPKHRTPWVAILALSIFTLAVTGLPLLGKTPPLTVYGYIGTGSGYGLILAYGGIAAVALIYAARKRTLSPMLVVSCVVGLGVMIYALYNTVHPFPPGVYGTVAWIAAATVAVALAIFLALRLVRPDVLTKIAQSQSADVTGDSDEADNPIPKPFT